MKEMKARLSAQTEDQLSIRMFGYEYFERTPVDKEHSIICRRRVADVAGNVSRRLCVDCGMRHSRVSRSGGRSHRGTWGVGPAAQDVRLACPATPTAWNSCWT